MRKQIIAALLTIHSFGVLASTVIPEISAPLELMSGEYAEGTLTRLSDVEVAEFIPWAQNASNQLTRALNRSRSLPLRERLPVIERAIRQTVSRSEGRQFQMFMRYALNRGLLLVDELEKNADMNEVGGQESALDILQRSIEVGLSFYTSDLDFQRRSQDGNVSLRLEHARFASVFMQGIYPGVINVLDATAQYRLLYKLVEMVNWDLSRDAEAPKYAETIVEAHEMLQDLPENAFSNDRDSLKVIRRLNSLQIISLRLSTANREDRGDRLVRIQEILNPSDDSGELISCTTSSNGQNFSHNRNTRADAIQQAVFACTSNRNTNNDECSANVTCDDGGSYDPFISCETSSNGRDFSHSTRSRSLSLRQAVFACTSDRNTNNDECAANAVCDDGGSYDPFISCETSSNGRDFSHSTRSRSLSLRQAVFACTSDRNTNNDDCVANVACDDGGSYDPFISCETSSNGRDFSHTSRSRSLSLRQAVLECTSDRYTDNNHCSERVRCDD